MTPRKTFALFSRDLRIGDEPDSLTDAQLPIKTGFREDAPLHPTPDGESAEPRPRRKPEPADSVARSPFNLGLPSSPRASGTDEDGDADSKRSTNAAPSPAASVGGTATNDKSPAVQKKAGPTQTQKTDAALDAYLSAGAKTRQALGAIWGEQRFADMENFVRAGGNLPRREQQAAEASLQKLEQHAGLGQLHQANQEAVKLSKPYLSSRGAKAAPGAEIDAPYVKGTSDLAFATADDAAKGAKLAIDTPDPELRDAVAEKAARGTHFLRSGEPQTRMADLEDDAPRLTALRTKAPRQRSATDDFDEPSAFEAPHLRDDSWTIVARIAQADAGVVADAEASRPELAIDEAPGAAARREPEAISDGSAAPTRAKVVDDPEALFDLKLSDLTITERGEVAASHLVVRKLDSVAEKGAAQARAYAPPAGDMNDLDALPDNAALAVLLFARARDAQIARAESAAVDDVAVDDAENDAAIAELLQAARQGLLAHLTAERAEILEQQRALEAASASFGFPTATRSLLRPQEPPRAQTPMPGLGAANAALTAMDKASSRSLALAEMLGALTPAEAERFPHLAPLFASRAASAQSENSFRLAAEGAETAARLLAESRAAPDLEQRLEKTRAAYVARSGAAWDWAEAQRLRGRGWGGFLLESGIGPAAALYSRSLSRFAAGLTGKALSRRSSALALAALFAATPEDAEAARFPIPHRQMLRAFDKLPAVVHPDLVRRAGKPWGHHPVLDKLMKRVGGSLKVPLGRRDHLTVTDDALENLAQSLGHRRLLDTKTGKWIEARDQLHGGFTGRQNSLGPRELDRLITKYGTLRKMLSTASGRTDFWRSHMWVSYRAMTDTGVPKRQAYEYVYSSFQDVFRQLHKRTGVRDIDANPPLPRAPYQR